jgi:hypothetical protein
MTRLRFSLAAVFLTLAGAAATQEAGPSTGGELIGGVWDTLGLRKKPTQEQDFVRESRPGQMDYVPLAPRPKDHRKTAAELEAAGTSLERAAAENRRRAARVKIPD